MFPHNLHKLVWSSHEVHSVVEVFRYASDIFNEVFYHVMDTEGKITNAGMILTVCILLSSSHLLQRN